MSTIQTNLTVTVTHSEMFSEADVREAVEGVLRESDYMRASFEGVEVDVSAKAAHAAGDSHEH